MTRSLRSLVERARPQASRQVAAADSRHLSRCLQPPRAETKGTLCVRSSKTPHTCGCLPAWRVPSIRRIMMSFCSVATRRALIGAPVGRLASPLGRSPRPGGWPVGRATHGSRSSHVLRPPRTRRSPSSIDLPRRRHASSTSSLSCRLLTSRRICGHFFPSPPKMVGRRRKKVFLSNGWKSVGEKVPMIGKCQPFCARSASTTSTIFCCLRRGSRETASNTRPVRPPEGAARRGFGSPSKSSTVTPSVLAMDASLSERGICPLRSQ